MSNFDINETIQSQYAASPHITKLVNAFWSSLNPEADIELFYNKVFSPDTAEGMGLDVWGRIVAIGREYLTTDTTNPYWGFKLPEIVDERVQNFGNAPYYKAINGTVRLTDTAYRLYIFLKAMINIGDGTLASLNKMIKYLFPNDTVYIIHTDTMVLRLVVESPISQADLDALLNLPWLPAGVNLEEYQIITPTWGLEGQDLAVLDEGNFATEVISV
jgi:hypothetical protein